MVSRYDEQGQKFRTGCVNFLVMTNFYERGGLWVLSQGVLLFAVVLLAIRFRSEGCCPVMFISGLILLTIGIGVGLAGAITLGRNITPFPKPSKKTLLVKHGIFSLIRHPIYTGVMLASFGWAQVWQSWPALLLALGLIPFFDAKARREEYWLRKAFSDYADYQRCVKRFIPWIY
jgi:protein-S-isoprenylcysteine O-methyltransferase Ste14